MRHVASIHARPKNFKLKDAFRYHYRLSIIPFFDNKTYGGPKVCSCEPFKAAQHEIRRCAQSQRSGYFPLYTAAGSGRKCIVRRRSVGLEEVLSSCDMIYAEQGVKKCRPVACFQFEPANIWVFEELSERTTSVPIF